MDFGLTLPDRPARQPADRAVPARRGRSASRTRGRSTPTSCGRSPTSSTRRCSARPSGCRRPPRHQPGVRATPPSRRRVFATLNDMFGNRTVCAHRARRLRPAGARAQADDAGPDRAGDPRDPRARRGARDRRRQRRRGAHPLGARRAPRGLDGRLRARRRCRSSGAAPTASCSRSPTRRSCAGPSPHVRGAAEEAGRDPDDITVLVVRAGLRRRRPRPRARPVPLVRRHGRQPRRRDRRALRRAAARCPRR